MRRLVVLGLVGALAFTFVGSPATRAATIASSWPVGQAPFGLAVDDTTGRVFVANSETTQLDQSGLVSVIDPATGARVSLFTTLTSNFVLVDQANRHLYSSNAARSGTSASVDVFDADSGDRLSTLAAGGLAMALDSGSGRLYVGGLSVSVIDTATDTVVAARRAPNGGAWFGVAVDPSRHHLYLTRADVNSTVQLDVLDDRDLTTIREIALSITPRFALAVDPATGAVYVAGITPDYDFSKSAFEVLDPDTFEVLQTTAMPGNPMGIAISTSRHRIYVSDGGQAMRVLDDTTFQIAETFRLPFVPGLPMLHPDGRLYVGNYNYNSGMNGSLVALDLNNHAPVIRSLALSPLAPRTKDVITASVDAFDPDLRAMGTLDPTTLSYEWLRNGAVILGQTGSTLDLSVAGNGDRGDTISVHVTASDGQLSTGASTSVFIADSAPTAAVSLNNSAPATTAVLSATGVASDPDNDPISFRFAWRVNGALRQSSSSFNSSDSFDLGITGNGDHGDVVVVELVVSDGTLDSALASASAAVVNSPPTLAVSLNTTTPTTKTVLVATVVGQDPDRDGLIYVYTWTLNGVAKRTVTTTATTDRYDISLKGNGKKGDVVRVTITASDGTLTSPAASLSATIR